MDYLAGKETEFLNESIEKVLLSENPDEKKTILLVDDEENNLQLLKRTLRGKYEILTATDGKKALDVVSEHGDDISLIVSDQRMPEMSGTEFLKQIAKQHPDIVKILLTGQADTDIMVDETIENLHKMIPEGKTSMLQDVEAGRKTEVDMFAGTMVELGIKYGIATPYNKIVKELIEIIHRQQDINNSKILLNIS